ncbi:MAG: hypothetical protein HPY75_12930 [Actinobacteria bacterium]|nr:hypothetical protein [Actinomycetota bacterium]
MSTRGREAGDVTIPRDPRERVVVAGAEGLHLLGRFFQAMLLNHLKDPRKVRTMDKLNLVVAVAPPVHRDCALTLAFSEGRVTLEGGVPPRPDVVLEGEPAMLMKLARMPAGPAALRFLRTHEGRAVIAALRSGELRIRGAARHPLGMMRFARLLAPGIDRRRSGQG